MSAALAPPPLGLGPVFGIPIAARTAIFGAVQMAIAASRPIPKFARGTEYAKAGIAMVNEEGAEIIFENGAARIANNGKPTLTYLKEGAKVKTAKQTERILESYHKESYIRSLQNGTNVASNANDLNNRLLIDTVAKSVMRPDQMQKAMEKAISTLPIQQLFIDERGYSTYEVRKNLRIEQQKSRKKLGGNG